MRKKVIAAMACLIILAGCGQKGELPAGTPSNTGAPRATEAPGTTEAPKATATPGSTEAPRVTATPGATEAPKAAATPGNTETSKATVTPGGTDAPKPTEAPKSTEAPKKTETPKVTEAPKATEAPRVTEAPEEPSREAEATEAPRQTEEPTVTEAPQPTEAPRETEPPRQTEAPQVTEPPRQTEAPQVTEPPAATRAPEQHVHSFTEVEKSAATCTESQIIATVCSVCGEEAGTRTGSGPLGHDIQTYVFSEPTCVSDGYVFDKCSRCDEQGNRHTPALGHDFEEVGVVRPGDCMSPAVCNYACKNCGFEVTRDGDIDPDNHRHMQEGTYETFDDVTWETVTMYEKSCSSCGTVFEHYEVSRELIVESPKATEAPKN